MRTLWSWLREEGNAKALQALLTGIPALFAGATYVYSKVWPEPEYVFSKEASDFLVVTNVNTGKFGQCPHNLVYNQPPYEATPMNAAEYRFAATRAGRYRMLIEYAADEPRPVNIEINKSLVARDVLKSISKSWCLTRWEEVGEFELRRGNNFVRIYRESVFPHLRTIKLVRLE
jgi:hypothetical protein